MPLLGRLFIFHDLPIAFRVSGAFLFSKAGTLVTSLCHTLAITVPMSGAKPSEGGEEEQKGLAPPLGATAPSDPLVQVWGSVSAALGRGHTEALAHGSFNKVTQNSL